MTDDPSQISVVYQDLHALSRQISGIDTRLERMRKTLRVDDLDEKAREVKDQSNLTTALWENSRLLSALVQEQQRSNMSYEPDMSYYHAQELAKQRAHRMRQDRTSWLQTLRQEVVPTCPCGQHQGIVFLAKAHERDRLVGKKVFIISKSGYGAVETQDVIDSSKITVSNSKKGAIEITVKDILIVVEHLCPVSWWNRQFSLAIVRGGAGQFEDKYPRPEYIAAFSM